MKERKVGKSTREKIFGQGNSVSVTKVKPEEPKSYEYNRNKNY